MSELESLKDKIKQLNSDRKQELLQKLVQRNAAKPFALSPIQEFFYFHHQVQPRLCNVPVAIKINGSLNEVFLQQALNLIINRHEALRTSIQLQPERVQQFVNEHVTSGIESINLMNVPQVSQEQELRQLMGAFFHRPFHFNEKSLLRAALIKLNPNEAVLAISIHHIVVDGWSLSLIIKDLIDSYEMLYRSEPLKLAPLTHHYRDYVQWLQQDKQQSVYAKNLDYWRKTLAGANTILQLPTDLPRPAVRLGHGDTKTYPLTLALSKRIRTFAQAAKSTVFMFFLTCYAIFLYRYTRETDILIGSPVSLRDMDYSEKIVGVFLNFLVFRIKLDPQKTFAQLLADVKAVALGAYAHQQCAFKDILSVVKTNANPSFTSLFQVFIAHNNAPIKEHRCANLTLNPILEEAGGADADLALFYSDATEQLMLRIEYSTELFRPSTINAMFNQFEQLITEVLITSEKRINEYNLLTETDTATIYKFSNHQPVPPVNSMSVLQLLNDVIVTNEACLAIVTDDVAISYKQLASAVYQVITKLRLSDLQPGDNVLVLLDNSAWLVLTLLALLELELRYIPVDRCISQERLQEIIADTDAKLVISDRLQEPPDTPVISLRDQPLQLDLTHITHPYFINIQPREEVAYLIYTSGSTGKPKASLNTHAGLFARMSYWRTLALDNKGRGITSLAPSFDVSLLEMFGNLILGNTLYPISQSVRTDINSLAQVILKHHITLLITVPQILQLLLERADFQEHNQLTNTVILGDVVSKNLVQHYYHAVKGKLYNSYGPSEACIFVTLHEVQPYSNELSVPIGKPVADSQIYIVNDANKLAPINVPGELCISGIGVAQGYLNRSELTDKKFQRSPWHEHAERFYRTGDLARWLPNGAIEFLGRIDNQIKFNGIRIEVEAIEHAICELPQITQAVVIVREDVLGDKRLHAFVTTLEPIAINTIRQQLLKHINHAIIPNFFHILESIPTNTSGKIDRKLLATAPLDSLASLTKATSSSVENYFYREVWQSTNLDGGENSPKNTQYYTLEQLQQIDALAAVSILTLPVTDLPQTQQIMLQLKNILLKSGTIQLNLVVPDSPYIGLLVGLLTTIQCEQSSFTFRVIIFTQDGQEEAISKSWFNLPLNDIYRYSQGEFLHKTLSTQFLPSCVSSSWLYKEGGVYIITGGLGGIGLSIAKYIAARAKCHLILLSRTDKNLEQYSDIQAIKNQGSVVVSYAVDLTDKKQLAALAGNIRKNYGPVQGIIHAAGYVDFGLLINKDDNEIAAVLAPKVTATELLQQTFLADQPFFIACSSTATHKPSPGTGGYIIGNTFIDYYVQYQAREQRLIKAIKWGMWRDVGMSTPDKIVNASAEYKAHYETQAMRPLDAVRAFDMGLVINDAIIYITKEPLLPPSAQNHSDSQTKPTASQSDPELTNKIQAIWARTLGRDDVGLDENFFEAGGHSLLALQLVNRITAETDLKIKLHDIFAYPTINDFLLNVADV